MIIAVALSGAAVVVVVAQAQSSVDDVSGDEPAARFCYLGVGSMMTSFSANVALPLLPSMRYSTTSCFVEPGPGRRRSSC